MRFTFHLSLILGVLSSIAYGRRTLSKRTYCSAPTARSLTYDYIVVGSGAGGGPLACRLAMANHSVLLIESGDDQGDGSNANYSAPGFQAAVTADPKMAWNIFVNHYQNQTRAQLDPKYVYETPSGGEYVGLNPPAGSTGKGIL